MAASQPDACKRIGLLMSKTRQLEEKVYSSLVHSYHILRVNNHVGGDIDDYVSIE